MERQPHHERGPEQQARPELERLAAERLQQAEHGRERQGEQNKEALEAAREQLHQVEEQPTATEKQPTEQPALHRVLTKTENYRQTMLTLRHRMKPAARAFSKVIHTPAIETASEVVGKTVLRPSVSLGATSTAVILTTFIYFYARYYGFELRGSEIWLTLLVGAVLGLLVEAVYKAFRRASGRL